MNANERTIAVASQTLTTQHAPRCDGIVTVRTYIHGKVLVLQAVCSQCGICAITGHTP